MHDFHLNKIRKCIMHREACQEPRLRLVLSAHYICFLKTGSRVSSRGHLRYRDGCPSSFAKSAMRMMAKIVSNTQDGWVCVVS